MTRSAAIKASDLGIHSILPIDTHVLLLLLGSSFGIVQLFGVGQVGRRVVVGACETIIRTMQWSAQLRNGLTRLDLVFTLPGAVLQRH